jgi:hypothetical protein
MDGKKTALGDIQVFEKFYRTWGLLKVLKSYC